MIQAFSSSPWTYDKLTSHINKNAEAAGYTRLSTIHKSTVHSILDEAINWFLTGDIDDPSFLIVRDFGIATTAWCVKESVFHTAFCIFV